MIFDEPSDNFPILDSLGLLDDRYNKHPEERTEKPRDTIYDSLTTDELANRLKDIKKRIDHLRLVFSTSLSREISREIDTWRSRFKELADVLIERDPERLYELVRGSEHLILSPPKPGTKPTVPLSSQRWAELVWEINQQPQPEPPKSEGLGVAFVA
jgi:hypothetical protein